MMEAAVAPSREVQADRQSFYRMIDGGNVTPLWEVLNALITAVPHSGCVPAHFKWSQLRPWLMQAGQLISALEAERRVLILENPGLRGKSRITDSVYAGLQLILPNEVAPAHRHSQSALRFILEGNGAYTAVDGERVAMSRGDFIITPAWTFHDHGNETNAPVIWLDGLDIPIVELLSAQFLERSESHSQGTSRTSSGSTARFGTNMLPVGYRPSSRSSPLFWYPYERSREALEVLRETEDSHPAHGYKLRYVNPATGGSPLPTIGAFLQLVPKGFRGRGYRSTDATVFAVVEGRGRFDTGDTVAAVEENDVFVASSWVEYSLQADVDMVLFSFSDRPVQEALDLWREELSGDGESS